MKIVVDNTATIERIGVGAEQEFKINFDAKMARILADGLYSDKVQSVIRELCCNAYDSHVMAGCPERPIEVHFPNRLNQYFHVRDFGVGLSHSEVMSIYTTYGASTKTQSNDVIGQLGLGSKSPFALTDAFTVMTRKNGVENHYSMNRNEHGMPCVTHMGSHATDEHDGVTVIVPVSRDLRGEFIEKAEQVFKWFPVKPVVLGESITYKDVDYVYTGNGWGIIAPQERRGYYGHRSYSENRPVAIMGLVAYPLTANSIKGLSDGAKQLLELPVVLHFDIGELEVAANREALGYDARTCNNIVAKMDKLVAELGNMFEQKIANAKSLWEAKQKFGEIFDKGDYAYEFGNAFRHLGLKWNGQVISTNTIKLDFGDIYPKVKTGNIDLVKSEVFESNWRYKRPRKITVESIAVECTANTVIMFNDLQIGGMTRVLEYNKAQNQSNPAKQIYLFNPSDIASWDVIKAKLGNPEVVLTSTLPKPARKVTVRTGMLKYNGAYGGGKKAWTPIEIDLDEGGYYVELDGWDIVTESGHTSDLAWWRRAAEEADLIPANTPVYAMRNKHKKLVKEHGDWQNFFDVVRTNLSNEIAKRNLGQEIANMEEYNRLYNHARLQFWSAAQPDTRIKDANSPLLEFINTVRLYSVRPKAVENLRVLAQRCNYTFNKVCVQHNLVEMYEKIIRRYPMLQIASKRYSYSYDSISGDDWSIIFDYVNYVDATATFYNLQDHDAQ